MGETHKAQLLDQSEYSIWDPDQSETKPNKFAHPYILGQKRSALLQLWFWSILQIAMNLFFNYLLVEVDGTYQAQLLDQS